MQGEGMLGKVVMSAISVVWLLAATRIGEVGRIDGEFKTDADAVHPGAGRDRLTSSGYVGLWREVRQDIDLRTDQISNGRTG